MMTDTMDTRMAVLETKVSTIEKCVEAINNKLDIALETKADRADLAMLENRLTVKADAEHVAALELAVTNKASAEDFKELRTLIIRVFGWAAAIMSTTLLSLIVYIWTQNHP